MKNIISDCTDHNLSLQHKIINMDITSFISRSVDGLHFIAANNITLLEENISMLVINGSIGSFSFTDTI